MTLRCLFIGNAGPALTDTGIVFTLQDGERIINVDHEGGATWIYIEKNLPDEYQDPGV